MYSWLREWIGRGRSDNASASPAEPEAEQIEAIDPFNPFPEPVAIPISDVIDLHTLQPRDVHRVVEEYLQQARQLRFRSVRIIHGKGIGVQREMVRAILERTTFVADWTDAPPQAGGLGATVVRLKPD